MGKTHSGMNPQWDSPQWKVRGTLPFFSLHPVLCVWMNDCGELRVCLSSTHAYGEEAGGSGHPGGVPASGCCSPAVGLVQLRVLTVHRCGGDIWSLHT